MELNNIDSFEDWNKWKQTLAKAVNFSEAVGMSEETIHKVGYRVGSFLAATVDPENREHRLMQELWKAGDDEERKALTKMIVKMVQVDDK